MYGTIHDTIRIDTLVKTIVPPSVGQTTINCDSLLAMAYGTIITRTIYDTVGQKAIGVISYRKGHAGTIQAIATIKHDTVFTRIFVTKPCKSICPPCPPEVNQWQWFAYGALAALAVSIIIQYCVQWLFR